MEIAIVGCGFIGTTVAQAAQNMEPVNRIHLIDKEIGAARRLAETVPKAAVARNIDHCINQVSLVVEAASQNAVRQIAHTVLEHGKDLLVLSVGALVEDAFREELRRIGRRTGGKVYVTSGAVAGIDGISSARQANLTHVHIRTTKPADALDSETIAKDVPVCVFRGSAREAALSLPRNVNVAATLGLAAGDLDGTEVEVFMDPRTHRNIHEVEAEGRFGNLYIKLVNEPSLTNPRTSYLAALAAVDLLQKYVDVFWIGN